MENVEIVDISWHHCTIRRPYPPDMDRPPTSSSLLARCRRRAWRECPQGPLEPPGCCRTCHSWRTRVMEVDVGLWGNRGIPWNTQKCSQSFAKKALLAISKWAIPLKQKAIQWETHAFSTEWILPSKFRTNRNLLFHAKKNLQVNSGHLQKTLVDSGRFWYIAHCWHPWTPWGQIRTSTGRSI